MIGQKQLLSDMERIKNRFPRFSIVVGGKGCGKKLICEHIAKILDAPIYRSGLKIDDIRETIERSYNHKTPILFLLADADNMSLNAKNSLLKITEEPPKNAYFVLTLQDINNTLETLQSRGTVFNLDTYTLEELKEYRRYRKYSDGYDNILGMICLTTGDVDELFTYDINEFYSFAKVIADNIQIPTNGNAFKITTKMKLKETDKGFEPTLLLKVVQNLFMQKFKETRNPAYLQAIVVTGISLQSLRLNTVSKIGTIDNWIMQVRKALNRK